MHEINTSQPHAFDGKINQTQYTFVTGIPVVPITLQIFSYYSCYILFAFVCVFRFRFLIKGTIKIYNYSYIYDNRDAIYNFCMILQFLYVVHFSPYILNNSAK